MNSHTINQRLLHSRVSVHLVGCGGNGSQMLTGLARLHVAMLALGHPGGLHVTAYDPDRVSAANVGRQLFSEADIGLSKATCLVQRVNCFFGLDWEARDRRYSASSKGMVNPHLLITCVDTAAARREIAGHMTHENMTPLYWLDLGNTQMDGQVILGEPKRREHERKTDGVVIRLPTVVDVFPELLEHTFYEEHIPSCSLAEALRTQGLFINQAVVTWGLTLLERLFRFGRIEHHGYFVNLESGRVVPLPVMKEQKEVVMP